VPHLQLLWTILVAPGMSAIWVLTNSCIADVCDEDELRTGMRREGFYGAVFSFTMKLGAGLGLGVAGIFLDIIGFDKDLAMQPTATVTKMRLMFAGMPALFFLLAAVMAIMYPITRKRHRQIQRQLQEKNTGISRLNES
jgi:GPH family glycoside/pentoside/hexuronide:cation symporter